MADIPIQIEPWDAAVDRLAGKTVVAARLKSAEWARVPLAIRERAFFSATLEQARALQGLKDDFRAMLEMRDVEGRTMDRSRIIERMRERLGALPGDSGQLTDLTSFRRQQVIIDFQVQDAYGHARWKSELSDPDALDLEPAWEFVRLEARDEERQNWPQRWQAAYDAVGGVGALRDRMMALKTSPIWAALSVFGRPWGPFDWGSGMGLIGRSRDEAEAAGLLGPTDTLDGGQAITDYNDQVKASMRGLDEETRGWLKEQFGDLAQFEGDEVRMVAPAPEPISPAPAPAADRPAPAGEPISGKVTFEADYREKLPRTTQAQVEDALSAIDEVHGDGPMPIREVTRRVSRGADGTYWVGPESIGVRAAKQGAEFHFMHEMGHRLDFTALRSALGMTVEATRHTPALIKPLMDAIQGSEAIAAVKQLRLTPGGRAYLLSNREMFARAYAQYIATRGSCVPAKAWLDAVRAGKTGYIPVTQWADEDFAPIAAAFDELFINLNWMRR